MDGLMFYKDGFITLESALDGFEKIINENFNPKKEEQKNMHVAEMTVKYSQEPDAFDDEPEQYLEIETCDAGGGDYYVITTKRWAVNEIDELIALLHDFKKRYTGQDDRIPQVPESEIS